MYFRIGSGVFLESVLVYFCRVGFGVFLESVSVYF